MKPPFTVSVTGGSGSGKTHFISRLSSYFQEGELCIVLMDHYYLTLDQQPIDEKGIINFDLPNSIDRKALKNDIERLKRGEEVIKQEYTFNNPAVIPQMMTFRPAPILIIEGLFVQYFQEIVDEVDLKIFIEANDQLKLDRRIKRDKEERGYDLEDVLYRYKHHATPVYDELIAPLQRKSDLIIPNNDDFEGAIKVLATFMRHKLTDVAY